MVFGQQSRSECEKNRLLLSAHIDGRLAPKEDEALQAHLAGCAECHEGLRTLQLTVNTLRRLPQAPVPRSFILEAPAARRLSGWYFLFRNASAAVAAALVAVLAFAYVFGTTLPVAVSDTASRAPQRVVEEALQAAPAPLGEADEAAKGMPDNGRADGRAAEEKAAPAPMAAAPVASGPGPEASGTAPAAAPPAMAAPAVAPEAQPGSAALPVPAGTPVAPAAASAPAAEARPAEQTAEDERDATTVMERRGERATAAPAWPWREVAVTLGAALAMLLLATAVIRSRC